MINWLIKAYPYFIIATLYIFLFYLIVKAWKDNARRERELKTKENEQLLLEQFWVRFLRNNMGYK